MSKYVFSFDKLESASVLLRSLGRSMYPSINEDWGTVYTVLYSPAEDEANDLILVITESSDNAATVYKIAGNDRATDLRSAYTIPLDCKTKATKENISGAMEDAKALIEIGSDPGQTVFDIPRCSFDAPVCVLLYQLQQ